MNEASELIADALGGIADQAVAPRPMAHAAWEAGHRRRRLSVLAASGAVAAVAIIIGVAVSLGPAAGPGPAAGSGPAIGSGTASAPGHGPNTKGAPPAPPLSLRRPIQFEQVASTSDRPCAAGTDEMPGKAPASCVHLTGTGMTITDVRSARVQRATAGGYELDIRLTPDDSRVFAALTRELAGLRSPHNQFAIIADGRVLARSAVETPITAGRALIMGFTSRAQAESIIR